MAIFGIGRKKRKKEVEREINEQRKEEQRRKQNEAELDPSVIEQGVQDRERQIESRVEQERPMQDEQRQRFRQEALADVTQDIPGMTDQEKRALQETANAQIRGQVQNYSRMLAGQMSKSGVRGGAAIAPQLDLVQKGFASQNQFQRDLLEREHDTKLQKLAAYMASRQGLTAEDILKRQQYADEISSAEDRARQKQLIQLMEQQFRRV